MTGSEDGNLVEWTVLEQEQLGNAKSMFGQDCCRIARFIGTKSCAEVAIVLRLDKRDSLLEEETSEGFEEAPKRPFSRRKRSSQRQGQPSRVGPCTLECNKSCGSGIS